MIELRNFNKLFLTLALGASSFAAQAQNSFMDIIESKKDIGFQESDLATMYNLISNEEEGQLFIEAVSNPYAPASSHTGEKFFKALSWYKDTVSGNRDGAYTLSELQQNFQQEAVNYIKLLQSGASESDRIQTWKWLQKLTLLQTEIEAQNSSYYPYEPRAMSGINFEEPWNAAHTIMTKDDFQKRVLDASYDRPVLIKFGLTYCIHCLLLENLASVPAVERKYRDAIDVYKIWWNPKDTDYNETNAIAQEQGVTSSPYFILYVNGQQVNAGYAFPDSAGEGMEEFLAPVL